MGLIRIQALLEVKSHMRIYGIQKTFRLFHLSPKELRTRIILKVVYSMNKMSDFWTFLIQLVIDLHYAICTVCTTGHHVEAKMTSLNLILT